MLSSGSWVPSPDLLGPLLREWNGRPLPKKYTTIQLCFERQLELNRASCLMLSIRVARLVAPHQERQIS
jgi:hypothetical protein